MHEFLHKFRVPTTTTEAAFMKQHGIGKFSPDIKPFTKLQE
jgi:hypothetical protein